MPDIRFRVPAQDAHARNVVRTVLKTEPADLTDPGDLNKYAATSIVIFTAEATARKGSWQVCWGKRKQQRLSVNTPDGAKNALYSIALNSQYEATAFKCERGREVLAHALHEAVRVISKEIRGRAGTRPRRTRTPHAQTLVAAL